MVVEFVNNDMHEFSKNNQTVILPVIKGIKSCGALLLLTFCGIQSFFVFVNHNYTGPNDPPRIKSKSDFLQ